MDDETPRKIGYDTHHAVHPGREMIRMHVVDFLADLSSKYEMALQGLLHCNLEAILEATRGGDC